MPDGDRFSWGVRGRGSRTLLNLVRAGTRTDLVADQAVRVVAEQCKSPAVQRIVAGAEPLLMTSLPRLETDASRPLPCADEVRRRLRLLRCEAGGEPFATVVLDAAERAYYRLQSLGQALSNGTIRRAFLQAAVEGILGHSVFNAKRHDLRDALNWSTDDQQGFERQLNRDVAEQMIPTFDRMCAGERPRRAPRRRAPRENFTLEKLHAPITVIR